MKTLEELAEDYSAHVDLCCGTSDIMITAKLAFLTGYEAAKTNLPTPAKWISVKEQLPEDHIYCLVTSKKEAISTPYGWIAAGLFWDMEIAYFDQKNKTWMTGELYLNCKEQDAVPFVVSHWMPLPEPPKDEL